VCSSPESATQARRIKQRALQAEIRGLQKIIVRMKRELGDAAKVAPSKDPPAPPPTAPGGEKGEPEVLSTIEGLTIVQQRPKGAGADASGVCHSLLCGYRPDFWVMSLWAVLCHACVWVLYMLDVFMELSFVPVALVPCRRECHCLGILKQTQSLEHDKTIITTFRGLGGAELGQQLPLGNFRGGAWRLAGAGWLQQGAEGRPAAGSRGAPTPTPIPRILCRVEKWVEIWAQRREQA